MTDSKKGAWIFWWICIFILPIVWISRFVISIVFWALQLSAAPAVVNDPDSFLMVIKAMLNWILGIIGLIGIPLTIAWIIMISNKASWLVKTSLRFGWKAAGETVWTWVAFLVLYFVLLFWLWFLWSSFMQPTTPWTFVSSYVAPTQPADNLDRIWFWIEESIANNWSTTVAAQLITEQMLPYYGMQVVSQILWILFAIAIVSASLKIVYGDGTLKFSDFFSRMRFGILRRYIVWIVLYMIAMILGFLLFIIPWIIIAVRCRYFMHAIIKDTMWPIDALKHSRKITKGHFWKIFSLQIMQWMIQIPGALALGIGLFWTIPTAYIADVKAYQILRGDSEPSVDKDVSRHTMSLEEAEAIIAE